MCTSPFALVYTAPPAGWFPFPAPSATAGSASPQAVISLVMISFRGARLEEEEPSKTERPSSAALQTSSQV